MHARYQYSLAGSWRLTCAYSPRGDVIYLPAAGGGGGGYKGGGGEGWVGGEMGRGVKGGAVEVLGFNGVSPSCSSLSDPNTETAVNRFDALLQLAVKEPM